MCDQPDDDELMSVVDREQVGRWKGVMVISVGPHDTTRARASLLDERINQLASGSDESVLSQENLSDVSELRVTWDVEPRVMNAGLHPTADAAH